MTFSDMEQYVVAINISVHRADKIQVFQVLVVRQVIHSLQCIKIRIQVIIQEVMHHRVRVRQKMVSCNFVVVFQIQITIYNFRTFILLNSNLCVCVQICKHDINNILCVRVLYTLYFNAISNSSLPTQYRNKFLLIHDIVNKP